MGVETRRNKGPDLIEHCRQGDHERHQQRDLDGHHKRRDHANGDHRRALGQMRDERLGQQIEQTRRAGVDRQHKEHHADGRNGADESIAQLDQMRDERLLGLGAVRCHCFLGVRHGRCTRLQREDGTSRRGAASAH